MPTELELLRDGHIVRVFALEASTCTLGRDLSNRIVLADPNVSGHHAVVEVGPDGLWLRDLGSTNGTFVNGEPLEGRLRVAHGDTLQLGPDVRLRVRHAGDERSGYPVLRDLTAGTVHVVDHDHFTIGSAAGSHVRLASGPERAALLVTHGDGELWLALGDDERPLEPGQAFVVAGSSFRVELMPEASTAVTARPMTAARFPYALHVTLDGAAGSMATLEGPPGRCVVQAEARVVLLYLLARQLQADREQRVLPPMAGWCHDEDLMIGVWGREALSGAASRYSVLLHRVRKDLEAEGFDPWCLEKRRGGTRLQVREVHIHGGAP